VTDVVRLHLPAGPDYGRVARVTTAAIARRHGFDYREVEDLRLAVDEALIAVIDDADPSAGVDACYEVADGALTVTLDGTGHQPPEAVARFHTLVSGLVDTATLDLEAGQARLVKVHRPT